MLYDTIREFVADDDIQNMFMPMQRQAYQLFAAKLETAHRFVLDRDSVMMLHTISEGTPKRMEAALSICRLPFPRMWVEFVFKDRADWLADAERRGVLTRVGHGQASEPARIGFLLEEDAADAGVIRMQVAWVHLGHAEWPAGKPMVAICHVALRIDAREETPRQAPEVEASLHAAIATEIKAGKQKHYRDPAEVQAAINLEARVSRDLSPEMEALWLCLHKTLPKPALDKLIETAMYDLMAEWRFVISLLAMLNSRNLIRLDAPTDVSKINKNRIKARKVPLLDHRPIVLDLSRVQRNRILGPHGERDLKAHLVHGHFKLRRQGLIWWSIHVRGQSGLAPAQQSYEVRAGAG